MVESLVGGRATAVNFGICVPELCDGLCNCLNSRTVSRFSFLGHLSARTGSLLRVEQRLACLNFAIDFTNISVFETGSRSSFCGHLNARTGLLF